MKNVELPKDAEGKEVPLDTKTLYDEYGNQCDVAKFTYDLSGETTDSKWTIEYKNGVRRFVSQMYLTTQPDSWKKLEEDLDRCISGDDLCRYFSKSGMCCDCTIDSSTIDCRRDSLVFNSIKERIHKLRSKE